MTGAMTTLGGVFHSLPFLIHDVHTALVVAGIVVACELVAISVIRKRFLAVPLRVSLLQVALGRCADRRRWRAARQRLSAALPDSPA